MLLIANMILRFGLFSFFILGGCNGLGSIPKSVQLPSNGNITQEVKDNIDRLLEEKLKLYLHLFFNEDVDLIDLQTQNVKNHKLEKDAVEFFPRSDRIRRTLNNSSIYLTFLLHVDYIQFS